MTASTEQERARVLFNPYTGERRHISDVQSDPQGLLIVAPGAELQAARRAPVVPQGWKLVPVEPTEKMLSACLSVVDLEQGDPEDHRYDDGRRTAASIHAAMLAAAPQPPEAETDSLGIPKSCGKPLCSPRKHHPLCDLADHIPAVGQMVAAPAQLPEPQAEIEVRSMKTYLDLSIHEWRDTLPDGTYKIYTEQQVRQLLAAQLDDINVADIAQGVDLKEAAQEQSK